MLYIVAAASAVAIASLSYATLHQPLTSWRADLTRRSELVRGKLLQGPALRLEHAKQTQAYAELLAGVDELKQRVPDQPREGEFLADLSRLAGEQGVAIEDFQRGAGSKSETHSGVTVSVILRGKYRGVCGLMEEVSKLPRFAELTGMAIRREPGAADCLVNLTYTLYYGLQTDGAASPDVVE